MFPLSWVLQNQPHPATPLGCFLEVSRYLFLHSHAGRKLGSEWQKGQRKLNLGLQPHS